MDSIGTMQVSSIILMRTKWIQCQQQVKPEATKLFKTPIDAVMAVFPLLFWETVTNEIDRYAAF
jgi:hypothetical protein